MSYFDDVIEPRLCGSRLPFAGYVSPQRKVITMEATVVGVQLNVTKQGGKGSYQVHLFTYQPDPYNGQPKPQVTKNIFTQDRNNPGLPDQVSQLQPGQRVHLDFDQTQYHNLVSVQVTGGGQAPPPQQAQPQYQQPPAPDAGCAHPIYQEAPQAPKKDYAAERDAKDAARQASIIRQTALKGAVEIVKTLIERDKYYPQKVKPEILAEDVRILTDKFEAFIINGPVDPANSEDPRNYTTVAGVDQDFQPESPFNPEDDIPF